MIVGGSACGKQDRKWLVRLICVGATDAGMRCLSDKRQMNTCLSGEQIRKVDETLHLVHEGRFCCPGGDCDAHAWLLNEGGLEPQDCAARCKEDRLLPDPRMI